MVHMTFTVWAEICRPTTNYFVRNISVTHFIRLTKLLRIHVDMLRDSCWTGLLSCTPTPAVCYKAINDHKSRIDRQTAWECVHRTCSCIITAKIPLECSRHRPACGRRVIIIVTERPADREAIVNRRHTDVRRAGFEVESATARGLPICHSAPDHRLTANKSIDIHFSAPNETDAGENSCCCCCCIRLAADQRRRRFRLLIGHRRTALARDEHSLCTECSSRPPVICLYPLS